jgi:hypothetical protein
MFWFYVCLILCCGGDTNKTIDDKINTPKTISSENTSEVNSKNKSTKVEKNPYIQKAQMELKEASTKTDCIIEYLEKKEEGKVEIHYETYCADFSKKSNK